MKKINRQEFINRSSAILVAKKIFIDSEVTKNITVAFELYQQILAEKERDIYISKMAKEGTCPGCGSGLTYTKCCGGYKYECSCGYKSIVGSGEE